MMSVVSVSECFSPLHQYEILFFSMLYGVKKTHQHSHTHSLRRQSQGPKRPAGFLAGRRDA